MNRVDRVVVVVFDGLRPDMIEGRMPTLHSFAQDNLWFTEARSVFPSMTRVATTSFATGQWPRAHGIVNNAFHMPGVVQGAPLDTSNFDHLSQLREQEPVVTCESLGHALAAAGLRMRDLTQAELAACVSCNMHTVSYWERKPGAIDTRHGVPRRMALALVIKVVPQTANPIGKGTCRRMRRARANLQPANALLVTPKWRLAFCAIRRSSRAVRDVGNMVACPLGRRH